jgi:hypothetical protein
MFREYKDQAIRESRVGGRMRMSEGTAGSRT